MKIDPVLRNRLEATSNQLNTVGAKRGFPPLATLATTLEGVLPKKGSGVTTVYVDPEIAAMFATAAVEVWLRAVHSFLISASLTEASPIWASVSGYYSSHYSIRALAHILGYFQLFRRRRIVRWELKSGRHLCSFDPKQSGDREHKFYWKVVKQDAHFSSDPLFIDYDPENDASDVGHRDRATYADHICTVPMFRVLDQEALKQRVRFISKINFSAPPIPRRSRFPDVANVQVVAYHRIIRFRQFVDEIFGGSNRFWMVHRTPSWTSGMINFQLTEQGGLASPAN
jgi:hypothetical protein